MAVNALQSPAPYLSNHAYGGYGGYGARLPGIAAALAATVMLSGCAPRDRRAPAERSTAQAPAAAPSAAATPSSWLRVKSEHLPFFKVAEAEADELAGFLSAGALLERRDAQSVSIEPAAKPAEHAPASLPRAPSRAIPGQGPLVHVYRSDTEQGWTFQGGLEAVAGAPSRSVLCGALAAPSASFASRNECLRKAQFALIDGAAGGSPRRLAAIVSTGFESGKLAVADLDALAGGRPAVRGPVEVGILRALRVVKLPEDFALLVAEESVRAGSLTGTRHALLVIAPDGGVARQAELPADSSEPIGEVVTQRSYRVDIEESPDGAVVRARGKETVQVIRTGATRSTRDVERALRWDRSRRRLIEANAERERAER